MKLGPNSRTTHACSSSRRWCLLSRSDPVATTALLERSMPSAWERQSLLRRVLGAYWRAQLFVMAPA